MRKTAAVLAIVALTATAAMAYPGGFRGQGGPCYGQGAGMGGFGPGMMGRGGFNAPCAQFQQTGDPVDDAGAKAKVQEYLTANLKGYEIADATKIERPMGSMYRFAVKDKNGNQFVLMVNPFGQVMGPIPVQSVK